MRVFNHPAPAGHTQGVVMRNVEIALLLALVLTGCSDKYHVAKEAVRARLRDPGSADFTDLHISAASGKKGTTVTALCGKVRGKDAVGQWGPYRDFFYVDNIVKSDPDAVGPDFHIGDVSVAVDQDNSVESLGDRLLVTEVCMGGTANLWE